MREQQKPTRPRRWRYASKALGLIAAIAVSISGLIAQTTPADVVLEYNHIHEMLAEQDPTPLLRIYDDGLVRVHYPPYMQRSGDYEIRLSEADLKQLFIDLRQDGVTDVDLIAAKADREAAEVARMQSTGQLHHISDVTHTVILLRPSRVPGLAATQGAPTTDQTIRWPNVYTDARAFPELAPVQAIAAAENRLQELLDRAVQQ